MGLWPSDKTILETTTLNQLVRRLAIPSMLAQFVNVLYSIVDRMYIGNIKDVGEIALAGAGVCGPIVTLISSFAFLIGIGGAPLMAIRMGENNHEGAKKILANCFVMLLGLSAILTAAAIALREPMLMFFGASEQTFPYANSYLTYYVSGTVFAILTAGLGQFITCQGFANEAMLSTIIGAVMNIILDPIFIFLFNMGVRGAAIATVISQACSCAFVLWFLFSDRVQCQDQLRRIFCQDHAQGAHLWFLPLYHHRGRQRADHRAQHRPAAVWRGAGRHADRLRDHRPELYADRHPCRWAASPAAPSRF